MIRKIWLICQLKVDESNVHFEVESLLHPEQHQMDTVFMLTETPSDVMQNDEVEVESLLLTIPHQ